MAVLAYSVYQGHLALWRCLRRKGASCGARCASANGAAEPAVTTFNATINHQKRCIIVAFVLRRYHDVKCGILIPSSDQNPLP